MPSAVERVEQAPACEVINLSETEKDVYRGAGWHLAHFKDGVLVELYDPANVDWSEDRQAMADKAVALATQWFSERAGDEVLLVMCSGYQLCEPRVLSLMDASGLARMARVIGDEIASM